AQPHMVDKYLSEAISEIERLIESKAELKLSQVSIENSLAAIFGIKLVTTEVWTRLREDPSSMPPLSVENRQRMNLHLLDTWLYLSCVLRYLNEKVTSVNQSVLDELAYRARQNAQALYSVVSQTGLFRKAEAEIPEDVCTDEEDMLLAEA